MTPAEVARLRHLLSNFDGWLEEHAQYESGDELERNAAEREEIAAALAALPEPTRRMTVATKDLHPGDICAASRQRVLAVCTAGLHIPAGKVEVELQRPSGERRVAFWHRRTQITILRQDRLAS